MGSQAEELEQRAARYVGAAHAVAFASARAAFAVALEAVGLAPGDEVITSVGASPVTAEAIQDVGARPALVDIVARLLTLDPVRIEPRVTTRTRVVLPVHAAGVPCDMDAILAAAARADLCVVEDGREALGATYRGRRVGALGNVTVMTLDGLGAGVVLLTTDRDDYATRFRRRRRHVVGPHRTRVVLATPPSSRAVEAGLEALAEAERVRGIRTYYAELYRLGLADVAELIAPARRPYAEPAYRAFIAQLQLERLTVGHRDQFVTRLRRRLVYAEPGFIPLYARPRYASLGAPGDFPQARAAHAGAVALPLDPRMSEAMVWRAIAETRQAVAAYRPGADRAG